MKEGDSSHDCEVHKIRGVKKPDLVKVDVFGTLRCTLHRVILSVGLPMRSGIFHCSLFDWGLPKRKHKMGGGCDLSDDLRVVQGCFTVSYVLDEKDTLPSRKRSTCSQYVICPLLNLSIISRMYLLHWGREPLCSQAQGTTRVQIPQNQITFLHVVTM